jgi:hypothetical protein
MELSYLAGILDASGYMGLKVSRQRTHPVIEITGPAAEMFATKFGGNRLYWSRSCAEAQRVLKQLRPYMILRAGLADRLLLWKPMRRGGRVPKSSPSLHSLGGMLMSISHQRFERVDVKKMAAGDE